MDEREAIAGNLMEHVKNNDVAKIELILGRADGKRHHWRNVLRYEFDIPQMMNAVLQYEILLPRLLSYEITTISPFHYAAMKGHNDVLVNFIDHDIPVDIALQSGTTVLQMACFGGQKRTVQMLIEVYKVDLDKQDKYGWSALHYACTEGHLEVVQELITKGIRVSLRDKDGTSAAYRAQTNGHEEVVAFLCEVEEADELLNVDPDYEGHFPRQPEEDLYSRIDKVVPPPMPGKKAGSGANATDDKKARFSTQFSTSSPDTSGRPPGLTRAMSERAAPAPHRSSENTLYATTLPSPGSTKHEREQVRALIRKQFESIFDPPNNSDYERPLDVLKRSKRLTNRDIDEQVLGAVGIGTLTKVMREEFLKIKKEYVDVNADDDDNAANGKALINQSADHQRDNCNEDYDPDYETLKHLPPPPKPPRVVSGIPTQPPPPLPPRNDSTPKAIRVVDTLEIRRHPRGSGAITLRKSLSTRQQDNMALNESIRQIAGHIGTNWKTLAQALPIEINPSKLGERIRAIEKKHPKDVSRQAAAALVGWRVNYGEAADVDSLIVALRNCGLDNLIHHVEEATQEFTA